MPGSLVTLSLSRIDTADETFRISTEPADRALVESIRQTGLLHPPILALKNDAAFIIVSGFRRVEALAGMGCVEISAVVLPGEMDAFSTASLAVADNAQHRLLNFIEQARAVALLSPFFESKKELSEVCGKLGLSMNPALADRLERLLRLPSYVRNLVRDGIIPLTIALTLESMDSESMRAFCQLFSDLRPTLNLQKEMLSLIKDIARSEDEPVLRIISEAREASSSSCPHAGRRERTEFFRDYCKMRRYPFIRGFEERMSKHLLALNLPENIVLDPPLHYEDTRFTLRFGFRSIKEFSEGVHHLVALIDNPRLRAILDKSP